MKYDAKKQSVYACGNLRFSTRPLLVENTNNGGKNPVSIVITDITGKIVHALTLSEKKGQVTWNTTEMSNGIYLYKLSSATHNYTTGKITVQH